MSANDKAAATYGPGRTTPPLEARVAAVLQDHVPEPVYTSAEEGYMSCYGCDWRGASYAGVYAHQAAMMAPVIADVWDEGYTVGNAHNGRRDANPYRTEAPNASDS